MQPKDWEHIHGLKLSFSRLKHGSNSCERTEHRRRGHAPKMVADAKTVQPIAKWFDFPKLSERQDDLEDKEKWT